MIHTFYPDNQKAFELIDTSGSVYGGQLTEIEGLTASGGGGIYGSEDARFRVQIFSLEAWNIKGETTIRRQKLIVYRTIEPEKDDFLNDGSEGSEPERDYFADIPGNSAVRLQVYLNEKRSRAILESGEAIPLSEDSAYNAVIEELGRTIEISTQTFGMLTFDRSDEIFYGEMDWNEDPVELLFYPAEGHDIARGLEAAETIWKSIAGWDGQAKQRAALELLEIKNENWLGEDEDGEDEEALTAADFMDRMTLESISFLPDGDFTFHYDDGDLFWGHSIQVSGSLEKGITDALFQG